MRPTPLLHLGILAACGLALAACDDESTGPGVRITPPNHSVTPALVKGMPAGVQAFSLVGSDDNLAGSPGFVFGGSADGMGLLPQADGTYHLFVNHEDNFSVSRVTLDATFKPVAGQYVMNSTAGRFRLCSATLATPREHGFGPFFITAGESGPESQSHAIEPYTGTSRLLKGLGYWSAENAVPLPKDAYRDRTVVLIGDDDSGPAGGQLALYVGNSTGDLDNGSLYVMARPNDEVRERTMVVGQKYPVVFRRIDNHTQLGPTDFNLKSTELKSVQFGRVEDIDYRKGSGGGREVLFNVTGQDNTGANADFSRTKYGRVYRLVMDRDDPTKGTLEVLLDGDDRAGPARQFQNPDNILVTRNYAYIQEDPNGYGDETHDARVYRYDLRSGALAVVAEMDHRRGDAKYNNVPGAQSPRGSWEFGAMLDLEHEVGIRDAFLLAIQPHTWTGDRYRGVDGGTLRPNEAQASQIVVLTGLDR